MKLTIVGKLVLAFGLVYLLAGCTAGNFLGRTTASYEPGGKIFYDSNKNQENFKADIELYIDGKIKALKIETTAVTPDAAIAAALQGSAQALTTFAKAFEAILPLLTKAAAIGATGGAAAPLVVK